MGKKLEKSYNRLLLELLEQRPIAFNPLLAKVANSARAGLFISQLLFWWNKGSEVGWIYKTINEVREETTLSRSEQDGAICIWKRLGILEVQLRGIPRRRYFKIDTDKLIRISREYQ